MPTTTIHNFLFLILLVFLDAFILLFCKMKIYFHLFIDCCRNSKNIENQIKQRIKKKMEKIDELFGLKLF